MNFPLCPFCTMQLSQHNVFTNEIHCDNFNCKNKAFTRRFQAVKPINNFYNKNYQIRIDHNKYLQGFNISKPKTEILINNQFTILNLFIPIPISINEQEILNLYNKLSKLIPFS